MSDETAPPTAHHYAAKILIGEPYKVDANGEDETNVATIVRRVRVITVKGEIFEQIVNGFGAVPTELDVVKNWDVTWKTDWTKVTP